MSEQEMQNNSIESSVWNANCYDSVCPANASDIAFDSKSTSGNPKGVLVDILIYLINICLN